MSSMTLNIIEEIATTIFTIIMNRAVDQISSGVEEFFKRRIANMGLKFNKPENQERTMIKFIEATEAQKEFIMKYIKEPVEAEKEVFQFDFDLEKERIRTESMRKFKKELAHLTEHFKRIID